MICACGWHTAKAGADMRANQVATVIMLKGSAGLEAAGLKRTAKWA
jgi:hypothetical protein